MEPPEIESSERGMQVTMLLADAAQAVGGKLYILGGGWSITGPMPMPSAVALYFRVPWDTANDEHRFRLELLDSDGTPVPDPEGNPVALDGGFETGRPPGLKRGTPIDVPMAVNVPPLPLAPDQRFEWRLSVDGETSGGWRLPFSTRPAQPPGSISIG